MSANGEYLDWTIKQERLIGFELVHETEDMFGTSMDAEAGPLR